jgi:SHS family lactate transporter-like MFS transporter
LQSGYAVAHGNDYATALALIAGVAAIAISLLVFFGAERKGVHLGTEGGEPHGPAPGFAPQQAE